MTRILIAGDHFLTPTILREALERRLPSFPVSDYAELLLPWPHVPFGRVGDVEEASGSPDELIDALVDARAAVTQMGAFTREVFVARPDLEIVGVCRGGPVNVDLEAATEAGVVVTYAPGRNAQATAEFAVALLMAAMRRIPHVDAELRAGAWRGDYYAAENVGTELGGAVIGLVGLGAVGRIVTRILRGFGSSVLAYDPYVSAAAAAEIGAELADLDEVLRRSDAVSLHARLTPETRHLIDARRLGLMRPGAVLVNAARGGLLDYAPLPALLESGRLGGLALDVFDVEPPPPDWPLLSAPNVVLSPHLAGATRQTAERAASIVADDIAGFLDGASPRFVANPAVLERIGVP